MRRLQFATGGVVAIAWMAAVFGASAVCAQEPRCLVLDIDRIGPERLAELTATSGLEYWLELDDELLACGSDSAVAALQREAVVKRVLGPAAYGRLRLAYRSSLAELEERGLRVVAAGGLYAVVENEAPDLLPLPASRALARQVANQPPRERLEAGEGTVAELVAQVDPERWFEDVESLSSYNRYSGGSEIRDAHDWLMQQFGELPGVEVESQTFALDGVELANVVATLSGKSRPDDWFIVGGHYDSISQAPLIAAPGAEDNASGCAGVLEMARIFSAHPPEATILFICYSGEEQGLFGSADHVRRLVTSGDAKKVGAMLNLDMIGFSEDPDLDCLLQSNPAGIFLADALSDSAQRHTLLRLVTSFQIGGSDHVPYAVFDMPAILSIENDWSIYPHYHRITDTTDHIVPEMAAEILRMNVGALARMSGNSDLAGCLYLEDEAFAEAKVSSTQRREARLRTASDRQGCFSVDPLARGKSFKLKVKSRIEERENGAGDPTLRLCLQFLSEPLTGRRVKLRQSGEPVQKARSDAEGCTAFEVVPETSFVLLVKGPEVPSLPGGG